MPALPPAAALPAGSADQQADTLAADVEAGGDAALPSLLAALAVSGITIRGADGTIRSPAKSPGQGIVLDPGQIEVLAMLLQNETSITLDGLVSALGGAMPFFKSAPVAPDIVDGLRTNANSIDPQVRFFARFVVGLIKHSAYSPADIMRVSDPTQLTLDGVAMELILLRLAADLTTVKRAGAASASGPFDQQIWLMADKGPCQLTENESTAMDAGAIAATTGFEKLVEYLGEHTSLPSGKIANFTAAANLLFAVAKAVGYIAATEVTVTMDPAPPLIRTKLSSAPGARAILVATQVINMNKYAQLINCFRIMLNAVGLDFSVPSSAKVEGAQVLWECWLGCGAQAYSNATGSTGSEAIVEFTRADPNDPSSGDTQHQRTDSNGQARIGLEGLKQPITLPSNANPVKKEAEIVVRFQLQPPSMSGDLLAAAEGRSVSFAGIVSAMLELLMRTNLLKFKTFHVAVTDWMVRYKVHIHAAVQCKEVNGELVADGVITQVPKKPGVLAGTADYQVTYVGTGATDLHGTLTDSSLAVWLGPIPGFPAGATLGGVGTFTVKPEGGTYSYGIECGSAIGTAIMVQ